MSELKFDELNIVKSKSIPFEEFFGEMELEPIEIKKRISFAIVLEDLLIGAFVESSRRDLIISTKEYKDIIKNALRIKNIKLDEYIKEYVDVMAKLLSDTNVTTIDRAMFIAENEANKIYNYLAYREALKTCKYKRWVTMKDGHVRLSHASNEGETIPINEYFIVGNSLLLFPCDISMNPQAEEVINCRCTVEYF